MDTQIRHSRAGEDGNLHSVSSPWESLHALTGQNPGENVGWSNPVSAGNHRALSTGEGRKPQRRGDFLQALNSAHPAVIHLPCPQQDAFILHQEQTDAPRGKKKAFLEIFQFC